MELINQKKILVAGATGGLGMETARLLKQSGARLFISGRNERKLRELQAELSLDDDQVFLLDISQEADVQRVAEAIHSHSGALDVLINAAGVGIVRAFEDLSLADLQLSLQANLIGPFLLLKYFLPPMKEQKKGLIINLPGVLGKSPMAGATAYAASKYGLNGMLKSLREELKRTDIRITNLYLGGTDTAFWDEDIEIRFQREKFVAAREAARAIWFLCQQPSSGVVSEMVLQPFNHQVL